MSKYPKVSIIIPLYVVAPRFFIDLKTFEKLDYPNFEILVVCDKKLSLPKPKHVTLKLIVTGQQKTGPAEKRDIALSVAKGEYCAFIDDDAYPNKDWLKNAIKIFKKGDAIAVGGPGVTPSEDNYWEQMTGLVYGSIFCGGFARYRFTPQRPRFVEDYPAYNLVVNSRALKSVGGYGNHFYGGEDTFLCSKLIQAGYKIRYDPRVLVYHHRRPLYISYLKQIANVGVHRGYFARVFRQTSLTPGYFLPSILLAGLVILIVASPFLTLARWGLTVLFPAFFLLAMFSVIGKTNLPNSLVVGSGIILTHIAYGFSFIKGFFTKNLVS